jgi:hypothetical protein
MIDAIMIDAIMIDAIMIDAIMRLYGFPFHASRFTLHDLYLYLGGTPKITYFYS